MKRVLLALLLIVGLNAKAQYVTIPDANFVTFLYSYGYSGCLNGNQLDTTCSAVVNDTSLFIYSGFGIHDITGIQYFDNLATLKCGSLGLDSIPRLPKKLKVLMCGYNGLTRLPALPATLRYLEFIGNHVTALPTILPPGLTHLEFRDNLVASLPALPAALQYLECSGQQPRITNLPSLPASLKYLYCHDNIIKTLPALPASLRVLNCGFNALSSLPALPNKLRELKCYGNTITALPALPDSLSVLLCASNALTAIPDLPDSLSFFNVSFNAGITCMPPLLKVTGPLNENPFYIKGTAITCLPNIIQHVGSNPAIDTMPICAPCSAPVFHFGKITTTTAVVLWTKLECITNYRLAYRVKGTSTWTALVAGAAATAKTISGLAPGTQYEIRMRTGCTATTLSAWSTIQTFTTDIVCNPPSGITVYNIKKDRATISWGAVASAYSYKIRFRVQGTSTWTNQAANAPVVYKVLTGLTSNTTYEYQLLTVCTTSGGPASAWTGIKTFTTLLRMEEGNDAGINFSIYPNPTTNQLKVSSEKVGDLIITDILGRTIIAFQKTQNAERIDVSALTPGVYFITLKTGKGKVVRKFVKE